MVIRYFFLFCAVVLALAPSVLKVYETSHWFRSEADPSPYDLARNWFEVAQIPYGTAFHHHDKTLMRVYYFIVPYILSAVCLFLVHLLPNNTTKAPEAARTPPRSYLVLRSLLEQTWSIPQWAQHFLWTPGQVSTAELLGIAVFLVLNWCTFAVRVKRSYPRGTRKLLFLVDLDEDQSKQPIPHVSWEGCEIWAKTLGILAVLNLGWYLILPIGRRSVMLEAFSLSWERAVKYHRWIGYYTMLLVLVHGIMYIGVWIHGDGNPRYDPEGYMIRRNLVPGGCNVEICDEDQQLQLRINYYGLLAALLMVIMTVFTLPRFRRQRFEWFYYTHHLFIFVLFFLCLHYSGSFIYLIPGVAMYMVDKIFPLYAYQSAGTVETRVVAPDVLEVAIPTKTQAYYGGAYVFLNVPEVSWLEWHPFSLTSAPSDKGSQLIFHLKSAGTWTQAVMDAAKVAKANGSDLSVRIDGFYGHRVTENLSTKDAVVLVGGGIGVTPMVSIARDLAQKCPSIPVTLLWVVRTVSEYGVLAYELMEATKDNKNFDVRVWLTLSQPEPVPCEDVLTKDKLGDLSVEEQAAQVATSVATIRSSIEKQNASNVESTPSYVFERAGFTPASNALVMALATVVALSAYALTWHIGETNEIKPEDKLSLFHMFMILLWLLAFFGVVHVIRLLLERKTIKDTKFNRKMDATAVDLSASNMSNTFNASNCNGGDMSSANSSEEIVESQEEFKDLLTSMVLGRVGCRPDFDQEFATVAHASAGEYANAGVLACGPMAMVKNITNICNKPNSGCAWGMKQENGDDIFFSFTEEDWEW